jgi:hypothetical protein
MKPLNDPRWTGRARSPLIAELLRRIEAGEGDDEVWGELYNQVCHQGGPIDESAYVVMPHLVQARLRPFDLVWLASIAGDVYSCTAVETDAWIREAYDWAVPRAQRILSQAFGEHRFDDLQSALLVLRGLLQFEGRNTLAGALSDLVAEDDWIGAQCERCGHAWDVFGVRALAGGEAGHDTAVTTALAAGYPDVAQLVSGALNVRCPSCSSFVLRDGGQLRIA